MYQEDFPRIDGSFMYNNLTIYVCFRPYLIGFLTHLSKYFELIVWSSNKQDYTQFIMNLLDPFHEIFVHTLDESHCQKSEDGTLNIKNLEVFYMNRKAQNVLIIDQNMQNFTSYLTSGIFLPPYRISNDSGDICLKLLHQYIMEFKDESDCKHKIKTDFKLSQMFEDCKQTQAFNKI